MTNDTNLATFRVVTAHDQIRELADSHGASPNVVERSDGRRQLSIERPTNGSAEALSWEQFFERFESTDQVLVYRPAEPNERDNPIFDVVDRDAVGIGDGDEPPGESVEDHTEPLATSDTGDHEPVAYDHGESVDHGDDEPEDASVAPAADTEHGPTAATEGLVLDEIHGAQSGMGRDVDDEFLVFENDGDQRLDLSGWVVHNDEGGPTGSRKERRSHPGAGNSP